jgi:hypothetical protein
VSTKPTSSLPSSTLTACLHDVQLTNNCLKFNSSRTELLLIGYKSTRWKINSCSLHIAEVITPGCLHKGFDVKSIDVILDSTFAFSSYLNNVSQLYFLRILYCDCCFLDSLLLFNDLFLFIYFECVRMK